MAGTTPHEAVENFVTPLRQSLMCLLPHERCHHKHRPGPVEVGAERALTFNGGMPMWCTTGGGDPRRYGLIATLAYCIIQDDRPGKGPIRVTIRHYAYDIVVPAANHDPAGTTLLSWHWHPGVQDVPQPHLHLEPGVADDMHKPLYKAHVPTARVALEDVIEFMIADLEVQPENQDWRATIARTRDAHVANRSWHHRP